MRKIQPLIRIRLLIILFIIALAVSGLTAIPLKFELVLLNRIINASWFSLSFLWPGLIHWIGFVNEGLQVTYQQYPFIGYGTDWLAFGHIVIALAFIGPLREPLKNIWVIEWGLIACILVVPWAFVFGTIRDIPFFWRLLDCSFGIFGLIPLWICRNEIKKLSMSDNAG